MKRIFLIFIALSCAAALSAQDLVILHTNDTHSHIDPLRSGDQTGLGGVIERAAYVDSVRSAAGKNNVLLLDAGDFEQGSSYFTILKGDLEVKVMNAMKYDAVCLGNHEFDNGVKELARRLKMAKFKAVCANYDFSGSVLSKYVKPYVILKRAGKKIGIYGLLTDVTEVVDREIAATMKYLDPVEVSNRYAEILKEKGCDYVICLTHIGNSEDIELASKLSNTDIIVGGHSHTFIDAPDFVEDADGNTVPVVTDGCWGLYVGNITVGE